MLGMKKETFSVQGMTCKHCEARVDRVLKALEGVSRVSASSDKDTVVVTLKRGAAIDRASMTRAIEGAGFEVMEAN